VASVEALSQELVKLDFGLEDATMYNRNTVI
jgi:hypothetical protein